MVFAIRLALTILFGLFLGLVHANAAEATKVGDVAPEISTEGLMREYKREKLPLARVLTQVHGFECMDAQLAARVLNLLKEGKVKEAAKLRAHKKARPACKEYKGPLNHQVGALRENAVNVAICAPLHAKPYGCYFVPLILKLPPPKLTIPRTLQ